MKATLYTVQVTDNSGNEVVLSGKVSKLVIKNSPNSADDLLVGINEDANNKITLNASDSLALEPRPGFFYDRLVLKFAFAGANPANSAVVIVERETEETVC